MEFHMLEIVKQHFTGGCIPVLYLMLQCQVRFSALSLVLERHLAYLESFQRNILQ